MQPQIFLNFTLLALVLLLLTGCTNGDAKIIDRANITNLSTENPQAKQILNVSRCEFQPGMICENPYIGKKSLSFRFTNNGRDMTITSFSAVPGISSLDKEGNQGCHTNGAETTLLTGKHAYFTLSNESFIGACTLKYTGNESDIYTLTVNYYFKDTDPTLVNSARGTLYGYKQSYRKTYEGWEPSFDCLGSDDFVCMKVNITAGAVKLVAENYLNSDIFVINATVIPETQARGLNNPACTAGKINLSVLDRQEAEFIINQPASQGGCDFSNLDSIYRLDLSLKWYKTNPIFTRESLMFIYPNK